MPKIFFGIVSLFLVSCATGPAPVHRTSAAIGFPEKMEAATRALPLLGDSGEINLLHCSSVTHEPGKPDQNDSKGAIWLSYFRYKDLEGRSFLGFHGFSPPPSLYDDAPNSFSQTSEAIVGGKGTVYIKERIQYDNANTSFSQTTENTNSLADIEMETRIDSTQFAVDANGHATLRARSEFKGWDRLSEEQRSTVKKEARDGKKWRDGIKENFPYLIPGSGANPPMSSTYEVICTGDSAQHR